MICNTCDVDHRTQQCEPWRTRSHLKDFTILLQVTNLTRCSFKCRHVFPNPQHNDGTVWKPNMRLFQCYWETVKLILYLDVIFCAAVILKCSSEDKNIYDIDVVCSFIFFYFTMFLTEWKALNKLRSQNKLFHFF